MQMRLTRFAIVTLAVATVVIPAAKPAFAARNKATAKPACAPSTLCTGPCSSAKWCNVRVCTASGAKTPTLGFCLEGSPFCPPKC